MREEEKQKSVRPLKTKWYKQKRWVYPAVYLGFAAVVLAAVLWYQSDVNEEANPSPGVSDLPSAFDKNGDSVPANSAKEVFKMPVLDEGAVSIQTKFYDKKASTEEQQAALVVFNNSFFQSTGIDLVAKEGQAFDVTASLSGTVVKAEKDPILGYVVVIEHADNVTTQYSSLNSIQVEKGNTVKQGDTLGQAGMSEYNKEAGVHAHFEIRKNGTPINPSDYFGQVVTAIPNQMQANDEMKDEGQNVDQDSSTEQTDVEDTITDDGTDVQESTTDPADDSSFEDDTTENHA